MSGTVPDSLVCWSVYLSSEENIRHGNHHCVISAAGLCDINEGSATSEDRCKSPTSGNMSFSVLLKGKGEKYSRGFVLSTRKTQTVNQSKYTYNSMYLNARGALVREED